MCELKNSKFPRRGFVLAALDYVKKTTNEEQTGKFKRNGVFGIEQDSGVASLAVVNMIFRGDGKNNIIEGNCFAKFLDPAILDGVRTARYTTIQSNNPPMTKVLMNPPFALKRSDEKEYKFINQALKQMEEGGILFSVFPYSGMVKPGGYRSWRENLLKNNTLLSVITFPEDLFYPIGVHTVGIFIKKGIPHPQNQNILWIRALNDGFIKSKGKRLPSTRINNDLERVKDILKAFLVNPATTVGGIEEFQKATPIDFEDSHLELVPEAYLDQAPPSKEIIKEVAESITRGATAFIITSQKEEEV
ncbi:MAG TPA: N-6 DNA methylase [Desulfobacteria bacterium]|nr:N-6 DNA methylase [Desulfobacteria bacterium]